MKFFLMFLTIFFSVLFGMHAVTVWRLSRIFEFHYSWKFFPAFVLILGNFVAAMFFARRSWNAFTRIWYIGTVSYLGILWMLCTFLLGYALIQGLAYLILPIPPKLSQYIVIGGMLILLGYSLYHARQISVKTVEIVSGKLSEPITIVQLSDLHLGALNRATFVEQVVARTNALHPDIVVITGDLLDTGASAEMVQGFNALHAPAFFVWGNHDQFLDEETVMKILNTTPITMLKNETVVYNEILQIIGLDYLERQPQSDVKPILASLAPDNAYFTLLLSHAPIDFPKLEGLPIDLELAGHTHSGQIFPFYLVVRSRYPKYRGLYTSGNQALYVSSGTGTWGPPMRLGTTGEITVMRLLPAPPETEKPLVVRNAAQE